MKNLRDNIPSVARAVGDRGSPDEHQTGTVVDQGKGDRTGKGRQDFGAEADHIDVAVRGFQRG